jgi:hypothetical protein
MWHESRLLKKYMCDLSKYQYDKIDYHIKYRRDEGDILMPGGCISLDDTKNMPITYTSDRIC